MLFILETTNVPMSDWWEGTGPPMCGAYGSPPTRPNRSAQQSLNKVLSTPLVDVPDLPSYSFVRASSPLAASMIRTGGVPALPTLKPMVAERSQRSSNAKAWSRKETSGEIIVSPMLKASLELHDKYVMAKKPPQANQRVIYVNQDWLGNSSECSGQTKVNGTWYVNDTLPPKDVGAQGPATLYTQYVGVSDPSYVRPLLGTGVAQATVDGLLDALIARVDALSWDGGMITSTIATTRSGTYDLLTDLAESRSTFQTISSCVIRILRAYADTKSRTRELSKLITRRKNAGRAVTDNMISDFNNQWLEFRYGITPIVLSLNSAIEWYNTRQHEYAKYRGTSNQVANLDVGSLSIELPVVTDRCFGKVRIDGSTGGLKLNPLVTALELVPMSLLLNWVCNIGDVLSAMWPPSGASQEVYTTSRSVPKAVYKGAFYGEPVHVTFGYYRINTISPEANVNFKLELSVGWRRMLDAFAFTYGPLKQALRK